MDCVTDWPEVASMLRRMTRVLARNMRPAIVTRDTRHEQPSRPRLTWSIHMAGRHTWYTCHRPLSLPLLINNI